MMYKNLKISQKEPCGGVEIYLDGEKVKGVKEAEIKFSVDRLPELALRIFVESVDVEIKE